MQHRTISKSKPILLGSTGRLKPKPARQKVYYFWETSVPERWKKILSKDCLVPISSEGHKRNTLSFLEETQQYINNIYNPLAVVPALPPAQPPKRKLSRLKKTSHSFSAPQIPEITVHGSHFSPHLPKLHQ